MSQFFGRRDQTVTHDIARGSNLDLLVRGFHGIGNRLVDAIGGGLQAIALALSTPNDNSEEVKQYAERIKKQVEILEAAAKSQQSKGE